MRRLSPAELHALKVAELGLDPTALDLTTSEALAAALRRAAGFLCPCSPGTLVRAIVGPLDGLVPDSERIREAVEETLEAMVAYGDLLEHRDVHGGADEAPRALLYAAPPSFVARQSGGCLLLGVVPDERSPLPPGLENLTEYINHVRRLPAAASKELRSELLQFGLLELSFQKWQKAPSAETTAQHLARMDSLLDRAPASRTVPGLSVIDPTRPVRYYRGRWTEPRKHNGRFVGRRRQAYGADLWCYIQLTNGLPERFIDLPLPVGRARGCDEAWCVQMAIDERRGETQRFRIRAGPDGTDVFEFFSPVPMWARRRWDAVGEPASSVGCLFAYRLRSSERNEEVRFIREMLWLTELSGNGGPG